jgi:hypothetical protein
MSLYNNFLLGEFHKLNHFIQLLDRTAMLFIWCSLISFVVLSNSDFLPAVNPEHQFCRCPSPEHYPNSTWKKYPFCGYELGAECRPLQDRFWCTGPSAVAKNRNQDCRKLNNMFCTIIENDHRERACGGRHRCKAENMDCGRNRSANPGFIYLNYGK